MVNKVVLQGRLTADPNVKQTQSGVSVVNFTVAWSEKYKETERKCFLPCQAWRYTADFIGKYFKKGSEILVEGELETNEWTDNDGNNKSVLRLTVDKAHFCGKRDSAGDGEKAMDTLKADMGSQFVEVNDDEPLPF